jgi:hypothetical protein
MGIHRNQNVSVCRMLHGTNAGCVLFGASTIAVYLDTGEFVFAWYPRNY